MLGGKKRARIFGENQSRWRSWGKFVGCSDRDNFLDFVVTKTEKGGEG